MAVGQSRGYAQEYPIGVDGRGAFEARLTSAHRAPAHLLAAAQALGHGLLVMHPSMAISLGSKPMSRSWAFKTAPPVRPSLRPRFTRRSASFATG